MIISLDLSKEAYSQLKIPPVSDKAPYQKQNLAVLMDSLCLSHDFNGTHFVIWQMKEYGVQDSWAKFLKFSYQNLLIDDELLLFPLCLSENDDILILALPWYANKPAFLYNNRVEHKTIIANPIKCGMLARIMLKAWFQLVKRTKERKNFIRVEKLGMSNTF